MTGPVSIRKAYSTSSPASNSPVRTLRESRSLTGLPLSIRNRTWKRHPALNQTTRASIIEAIVTRWLGCRTRPYSSLEDNGNIPPGIAGIRRRQVELDLINHGNDKIAPASASTDRSSSSQFRFAGKRPRR